MPFTSKKLIVQFSTNRGIKYSINIKSGSNAESTDLILAFDLYPNVWTNGVISVDKKPLLEITGIFNHFFKKIYQNIEKSIKLK